MVTLEDARTVIAAAERKAKEIKQPMNIAVADAGGNLVAHVRMDEAWMGSIDIAIKKAFTSRAFDISTKNLAKVSQSGGQFFGIHASNEGRVITLRLKRTYHSVTHADGRRILVERLWRREMQESALEAAALLKEIARSTECDVGPGIVWSIETNSGGVTGRSCTRSAMRGLRFSMTAGRAP
jgi:hypothetical protein